MRYGEGLLAEILRRTDVVQLVGRRVKLTRKGRVFWGLCPFHKEKTPSFKVDNERRTYHCFGCGAGGDAFKWLQETEGLSFPEAVRRLAHEAGVELPKWTPEDEAREQKKKSLFEIIELAAAFYEEQLRGRAGEGARTYLKSRGLDDAVARRFRLGYAPDAHTQLKDHLAARRISIEDMIEAGLVRQKTNEPGEEGKPARDFFFNRVMFPITDARGRVVAFGGRALSPDAKPKYINTGETPLFSKGHLLYNLKFAREAVAKGAPLILAEGYMDVIALVRSGFEGAVAPLGTALTENQLAVLWTLALEPVLCFDGDEAGARAAARAARLALPMLEPGQSLRFVFLPAGQDPDSFLRSQGAGLMRTLIEKARSLADVLWAGETEGRDFSTPERRAGLEAALERTTREIRNAKIADYYRREFDERVFRAFKQRPVSRGKAPRAGRGANIEPPVYRFQTRLHAVQITVTEAVRRSAHAVNASTAARQAKERELLGLLLWTPELVARHAESLAKFRFFDQELDRLRHELLNLAASQSRLEKAAVENHLLKQGFGELAGRLKAQSIVRTALAGGDENALDGRAARAIAQLRDPELPEQGDLKLQRDEALKRYLEDGAESDWEELQRLNDLLRANARPEL
ncbi:MAG: DNA primase [Alphaproteobacteria bacterium]